MRGWLERRRLRRRAWELVDGMPNGPELTEHDRHAEPILDWLVDAVDLGFPLAMRGFWKRSPLGREERVAFSHRIDGIIERWPEGFVDPRLREDLDELRAVIVRYDELLR